MSAADAEHLATAIATRTDRFIMNNSSGISTMIIEIELHLPDELTET